VPRFGHLPYVMGEGNKKLSKRDPQAHLIAYREQGFLPEGLLNYLALLGWAIGPDRDVFTIDEMVEAFDIKDVNPNPARFDLKKAEAINADHMRMLTLDDLTDRVLPFLKEAGVIGDPVRDADAQLLEQAMPLVAERMNKLTEASPMLGFLFADEDSFTRTDEIDEAGRDVVRAAYDALATLDEWGTAAIEAALRQALVDDLGLKLQRDHHVVVQDAYAAGSDRADREFFKPRNSQFANDKDIERDPKLSRNLVSNRHSASVQSKHYHIAAPSVFFQLLSEAPACFLSISKSARH